MAMEHNAGRGAGLPESGQALRFSWSGITFGAGLELVQVIRLCLHHLAALGLVRSAVVGASIRGAHGVGELVLDVVGSQAQHFIQDGARHRPAAVAAHFILTDAHAPHGSQHSVVAHGAACAPGAGEDVASPSAQRLQIAQDGYGRRDRGTKRHSAASRSMSAHSALRSSPGRTKTSSARRNARAACFPSRRWPEARRRFGPVR